MESNLKRVDYVDPDGRHKAVFLPADLPETEAWSGIPIGPPNLSDLELPLATEVRLNNELYHRGILTVSDATKRRPEVMAALQSAFRVDAGRIVDLYLGRNYDNGNAQPSEKQPDTLIPDRGRRGTRQRSKL